MSLLSEFLFEWRSDARFSLLVQSLRFARPEIPAYPKVTTSEEWIHASGERKGFDVALSLLQIDLDKEIENV